MRRYLRQRDTDGTADLPWLVLSERGSPLTRKGVYYIVTAAAKRAACMCIRTCCATPPAMSWPTGRDLRLIQDYLGHRDPKNSARYTQTAAARFENIFGR